MAKKSIKSSSSKSKSTSTTPTTSSDSSTPFSTGLNFHTGSFVNCKAEDTSFFCTLTKVFNGLFMIIAILVILYLIYYYAKIFFFNKKR